MEDARKTLNADCVIPAAGTSSRMGSWKLLLPCCGTTVIEHCITSALSAVTHGIIVTGYRAEELTGHLHRNLSSELLGRLEFTCNTRYHLGMFSSIQAGLRNSSAEIIFILHADLPRIPAEMFVTLTEAAAHAQGRPDIVRPICRGIPGHPVLLTASAREAVLALPPEASMQEAFRRLSVLEIDIADSRIIEDIDTPEAYRELIRKT